MPGMGVFCDGHACAVQPCLRIMKIPTGAVISHRQKTSVPNHHLWNNHGIWWFHATVHLPDYTSRRIRFSLRTRKLGEAKRRRDELLERVADKNADGSLDLTTIGRWRRA